MSVGCHWCFFACFSSTYINQYFVHESKCVWATNVYKIVLKYILRLAIYRRKGKWKFYFFAHTRQIDSNHIRRKKIWRSKRDPNQRWSQALVLEAAQIVCRRIHMRICVVYTMKCVIKKTRRTRRHIIVFQTSSKFER